MQRTGRNGRIFRLQWSACGIWLGLFLLASFTGQSQSVRDLIQQHLDTLGGHSVWSNIHSYILEWEEVGRSGGRMLRQTYWKDTACRDDYYIPKRRGDYAHYYRIVNKEQGWIHLPYNAYNTIITLRQDEVLSLRDELNPEDPFLNTDVNGKELNLLRLESIHGQEYEVFELTGESGLIFHYYLNVKTQRIDVKQWMDGDDEKVICYFSYSRLPEGLLIPEEMLMDDRRWILKSVTLNPLLRPADFNPGARGYFFN